MTTRKIKIRIAVTLFFFYLVLIRPEVKHELQGFLMYLGGSIAATWIFFYILYWYPPCEGFEQPLLDLPLRPFEERKVLVYFHFAGLLLVSTELGSAIQHVFRGYGFLTDPMIGAITGVLCIGLAERCSRLKWKRKHPA